MKYTLFLFFSLFSIFSFSQDDGENPLPYVEDSPGEYFVVVDVQAEFPGGMPALGKFINENKQYPKYEKDNCIQGKINVQFYVDTTGKIIFVKPLDFVQGGKNLQTEAVRLVSSMPKWTPAKVKGKKVIQQLQLTIEFKLKDCVPAQPEDTLVYAIVEEFPQFPGGADSLTSFFARHVINPNLNISGKVYIKFIVKADGSITNIQIIKAMSDCNMCGIEAMRVAALMPKWKPGKINGKAVNSYYNIPVTFKAAQ